MRINFFILSVVPIVGTFLDDNKAIDLYLYQLGYLQPEAVTRMSFSRVEKPWSTKEAIKAFQAEEGLKQTGVLDATTVMKMGKRNQTIAAEKFRIATGFNLTAKFVRKIWKDERPNRCGRPETIGAKKVEAFIKWKKANLTYSIDRFSHNENNTLLEDETRALIEEAFAFYSAKTYLTFTEVNSEGDIQLKFKRKEHGDGQIFDGRDGILAHAFYRPDGKFRIHFDEDEYWENLGASDNKKRLSIFRNSHIDFLTIAIHEIGHALGLEHVMNNSKSVMAPMPLNPVDKNHNYLAPRLDDAIIANLKTLYSAPIANEPPTESHGCMNHVYAVMSLPGHRIVFFPEKGTVWTMFNSESLQMVQNISVADLLIGGPSIVRGAYYNQINNRIVLFNKHYVWAYDYDEIRSEVALANNYNNKNYTEEANFDMHTRGAFIWNTTRVLVSQNRTVSYYDQDWNKMERLGNITKVFKNMPLNVKGFAEYDNGTYVGFTDTEIFTYRRNLATHVFENNTLGKISHFFNCNS